MFIIEKDIIKVFIDVDNLNSEYISDTTYLEDIWRATTNITFHLYSRSEKKMNKFNSLLYIDSLFRVPINNSQEMFQSINEQTEDPFNTLFLSSSSDNIHEANGYLLNTMFLGSSFYSDQYRGKLADIGVNELGQIKDVFTKVVAGNFNERFMFTGNFRGYISKFKLSNPYFPDLDVKLFCGGRYFKAADIRSKIHPLTRMLLDYKNGERVALGTKLSLLLSRNLTFVETNEGTIDLITSVPARPGKIDRLKNVLNYPQMKQYSEKMDAQILTVNEDYPSQKEAGNWENRASNVNGVFRVNKKLSGHVVLVDDIITSGATTLECANELLKNGAERVTVVCFAMTQDSIQNIYSVENKCPSLCGGHMKIRYNNNDGSAFWGCSRYPSCGTNLPLNRGLNNVALVTSNVTESDDDFFDLF
jgi:predicted amidophosphoribosyltransferase